MNGQWAPDPTILLLMIGVLLILTGIALHAPQAALFQPSPFREQIENVTRFAFSGRHLSNVIVIG